MGNVIALVAAQKVGSPINRQRGCINRQEIAGESARQVLTLYQASSA